MFRNTNQNVPRRKRKKNTAPLSPHGAQARVPPGAPPPPSASAVAGAAGSGRRIKHELRRLRPPDAAQAPPLTVEDYIFVLVGNIICVQSMNNS